MLSVVGRFEDCGARVPGCWPCSLIMQMMCGVYWLIGWYACFKFFKFFNVVFQVAYSLGRYNSSSSSCSGCSSCYHGVSS